MFILTLLTPARAVSITLGELTAEAVAGAADTLGIDLTNPADAARRLAASFLDSRSVEGKVMTPEGILTVRRIDGSDADLFRVRVPSGWLPLMLELHAALSALGETEYVDVKPKWGELRVYLPRSASDRARELVREATARSVTICEVCGDPGGPHRSKWNWYRTLCPRCAAWMEHTPVDPVTGEPKES